MSEGDGQKCALEGVGRVKVPEGDGLNDINSMFSGIFLQSRKIGMTSLFCLLSSTVHAECVPTPDCASIGYTATSCDDEFVRCPFDTSKLFCLPCDSSYQYSCNGTGQKGKGTACNGKYIECECSNGYDLVDGACIVSCSYNLTSLPTGCSAVSDSCVKNATTYYSSICTSCKNGYTLNSGTCKANTCDGYGDYTLGCSEYSTCQSGTTTKYKCTACESGYSLCEENWQCLDAYCYNDYIINELEPCSFLTPYKMVCSYQCEGSDGIVYGSGFCTEPMP